MIEESEVRQIVREEIRRQVNILLFGSSANATEQSEDIQDLFPGMPGIQKRPVMHPYGFSSKAPAGTIQVVGQVGEHIGNKMVLGHRAKDRPTDFASGECVLYNEFGQKIYIKKDKIQVGSSSSNSPMVLGDVLKDCIKDVLNDFLDAAQIGFCAVGPVFLDPDTRAKMTLQLEKYVTDDSTNVVSKLSFTERGGS